MTTSKYKHSLLIAGTITALLSPMASASASEGSFFSSLFSDKNHEEVTTTRDVTGYDKILVKGALEMDVKRGDFNFELTTQGINPERIKTYVKDGTLYIDMEDDGGDLNFDDADISAEITMPNFAGIEVRGAVDAEIKDIKGGDVMVDLRGAGSIDLSGSCDTVTVDIRGAGDIEAEDLKCDHADVKLRGAGNADVYARETAKARLAGIGNISIYGKPKSVDQDVGGLGIIDIDN